MQRGFDKLSQNGLNQLSELYWDMTPTFIEVNKCPERRADVGLQAKPRYDAGGRLKEKWQPNGVNSRYVYFTDNTLAQVVNRSLTASI